MSDKDYSETIKVLRKTLVEDMAREILSVQPMPDKIFADLLAASTPRSELEKEGYEPVSSMGLLWRKKTIDE